MDKCLNETISKQNLVISIYNKSATTKILHVQPCLPQYKMVPRQYLHKREEHLHVIAC